jgi:hypothetical protein
MLSAIELWEMALYKWIIIIIIIITRSELRGGSCEDWKSAFKHYSSSPTISDIEPAMEKRIPHKVNISKDLYQIHIRMGNKTWNSQNVISIFWFAQMDYSIPKSYTNSTTVILQTSTYLFFQDSHSGRAGSINLLIHNNFDCRTLLVNF